jgi:transposase
MLGSHGVRSFVPRQHDIFIGLDVDKHRISVTCVDHDQMVKSCRMPYQAAGLLKFVERQFPHKQIAFVYEAGPTGFGLHDELTHAGYPCLVVTPSMVPQAAGVRVKTNRLDSQKLAENLRGGQLKGIHVPSQPYRQLRHLTQLRDTFVQQSRATQCRMKALLLLEGLAFPGTQWSHATIHQLEVLACSDAVHFKLCKLIQTLRFAQGQIKETTKEILRFCHQEPEMQTCLKYLISIPGIGTATGTQLLARIGDWRHLRHVRQLASFLGLVASEHSTGETIRRGRITHAGDSRLRNKLIQGAWAAIRQDPQLRDFYWRIYHRHPAGQASQKAIVAVARKLTTRIYAVLTQQRVYVVRTQEEQTPPGETRMPAEPAA